MNYLIRPVKFRRGGRILEKVDLKNYTGHITIDITPLFKLKKIFLSLTAKKKIFQMKKPRQNGQQGQQVIL